MTPLKLDSINLVPDKDNKYILLTISAIGISEKPFYVDVIPDIDAENGECFKNVIEKVKAKKGEIIFGWQLAEYSFMIEAEFHAIWRAPDGRLIDITPNADRSVTKILFVIDPNKKFDGNRTDNFRFNTSNNALVDDMIEIEKAKFKIIDNAKEEDSNGQVIFSENENFKWQLVNLFSYKIDCMLSQNATIKSICFCNSGLAYELCHRQSIRGFLLTI